MANYLTPNIIKRLHKSYVCTVAEYVSPLRQPRLMATHFLALERLQVRVALQLSGRLGVTLLNGDQTAKSKLLERIQRPSLTWHRHVDTMPLFHYFFHLLPAQLNELGFHVSENAGHLAYLLLPLSKTYNKSVVLFSAAKYWNFLPADTWTISSLKKFFMPLKSHVASSCYNVNGFLGT